MEGHGIRAFGTPKGRTLNVSANSPILGGPLAPIAKVGMIRVTVALVNAFDFGYIVDDQAGAGSQLVTLGTLTANKSATFSFSIKAGSKYDFFHNGGGVLNTATILQLVAEEVEVGAGY